MQFDMLRVSRRNVRLPHGMKPQSWTVCMPVLALSAMVSLPALAIAEEAAAEASRRMSQRIDQLLDERLRELGWQAAVECDDASFLRRASLDLSGVPPTASEVVEFMESTVADKRRRLLVRLLESNQSANHLAETWAGWMLPEDNLANFGRPDDGLRTWLRNRISENLRYDRLVSDLMVSTGPAEAGPTAFFVALEGKPEKLAAKTARVFMGVQLDCAECHDHPFDTWSQRDFWGLAAYFAQLSTGTEPAGMGNAGVTDLAQGSVTLPGSEEVVEPRPLVQAGVSGLDSGTRRQRLSLWLTAPENPFLARATVNRVWALLLGRGLIEPVDDMRGLANASHPQLLKELSEYFASTGYDLRDLILTIATTRAYSRAALHPAGEIPEASYAAMATKPLTERQLTRSLASVARQLSGADQAAQTQLESQLGKLRGDASEAKLGIVSALATLHGQAFDQVSRDGSSRLLLALTAPHLDDLQRVKWMYLSVVNRNPSNAELQYFSAFANQSQDEDAADATQRRIKEWHSDLLWALLNSTEFAMTP
jgi:hypothetical protein